MKNLRSIQAGLRPRFRGSFGETEASTNRFEARRLSRSLRVEADDRPVFGLASDVAANLFVVLFLAFAVSLSMARPPSTPTAYDLTSLAGVTERVPSSSAALVAGLFRRQAEKTLSIDLLSDRLRLAQDGRVREWTWETAGESLDPLTAVATGVEPIDLFVFDPRGYAFVQKALRGHALQETNVPAALRSCPGADRGASGCADGLDWSAGFQRLLGLEMSQDDFRSALARILAARADGTARKATGGNNGGLPSSSEPSQAPRHRVPKAVAVLATILLCLGGIELIARARPSRPFGVSEIE